MMLRSTSDYRFSLAAFAATCLVGTSPVHADMSSYGRVNRDQFRLPSDGNMYWQGASTDGQVFLYVEEPLVDTAAVRETTEQEHLIATIRRFEEAGANWDGEGALAPDVKSVRAAGDFVCQLPAGAEMPEPLLHATGRAGLSWSSEGYYGELEFLQDGVIAYYVSRAKDKHKGVITLVERSIPPALEALLPI